MNPPGIKALVLAASVYALAGPGQAHAAKPCDALYNAAIRSLQTPHHVYSTRTTRDGKSKTGEALYAGGAEYLRMGGQWRRSKMPQNETLEAAREKLKTHPDTCVAAGEATVDGQPVMTWTVHNGESETDSQVHILSSGLLLGQTLTLPDGSVVKTRYDYANVQPPAGVK
jgi:hypothetical protein